MRRRTPLLTALALTLLTGCGSGESGVGTSAPPSTEAGGPSTEAAAGFERLPVTTTEDYPASSRIAQWREQVPDLQELSIPSTADGTEQPAFFVAPPEDAGPAPLLVVLHSWSSDWRQENGIPYAQFAQQEGWAMIAPDFRGINQRPESTGSDLVVQDVLDAVDEADRRADVDPEQVYLVGFSGGGHLGLLMAGRHPDRFAGVVSWVPIHDLTEWYAHRLQQPDGDYVGEIVASCGGDPSQPGPARAECLDRSPVTYLDAARDSDTAFYLAAGIDDQNVPPDHTLEAFNQLAPDAAVAPEAVESVAGNELPSELGVDPEVDIFFGSEDPDVVFARSADDVTVVLFDAGHAMVFNPGMAWLVDQAAS
ncbi:S9 family peptidase [uncultured Modestobacter sp.]|uniref:alpha/beta hydrolase family protein n=1 Tax=uncultured Modestobacter sp. TaxID=380048 RepID=UPI0026148E3A|nr:alpha/beta fold hydrolase [uncultured Modestobacter sp.]